MLYQRSPLKMSVNANVKNNLEKGAFPESTPPTKTINDVPPEVLEKIIIKLGTGGHSLLPYRLVHHSWEHIIKDLLEKIALKGNLVTCSKAYIVNEWQFGLGLEPTICLPSKIFHHPGNPFPSRSLLITSKRPEPRYFGPDPVVQPLETSTTKFGSHLNILVFGRVNINFSTLIKILTPLSNLRALHFSRTCLKLSVDDDLDSFPPLPRLITLSLNSINVDGKAKGQFFSNFIEAYANHIVTLETDENFSDIPLQQRHALVQNNPFQNLQQLEIVRPTKNFLELSCAPPLKRLYIVGVCSDRFIRSEVDVDVLMSFVDKFCNTLECLDLNVTLWRIVSDSCKQEAIRTGGILQTAAVLFPKLTKLKLPYASNKWERNVIKKSFLVKFPAAKEILHRYPQINKRFSQ